MIIGGSIYMGQMQKAVSDFCSRNLDALLGKKIGLFVCCGSPQSMEMYFKTAFPAELIQKAEVKSCFGGEIRKDKLTFLHKMIVNMVAKAEEKKGAGAQLSAIAPLEQNIAAFAARF